MIVRKYASEWAYQIIILALLSPFAWMIADREPPWTRLSGHIDPTMPGDTFVVHWKTTPLKRWCPGLVQTEIISGSIIWPVLRRRVSSEMYVGQIDYDTQPWPLDADTLPGRAIYRVTTFWYCNWLQDRLNWPIIQVGPDIPFVVLPKLAKPDETGSVRR